MIAGLITVLTVFFIFPPLPFILVYILVRILTKNTKKAIHKALDYTTIFFIIAVHFLILAILGKSLLWLIIIVILISAMSFVLIHWKIKGDIVYLKVVNGFWRFTFIIFFAAYFGLTLFGLVQRAIQFTFFS